MLATLAFKILRRQSLQAGAMPAVCPLACSSELGNHFVVAATRLMPLVYES